MATIKRPNKWRATYALVIKGKTIQDPRIDQINLELKRGVPRDELEARLKRLFLPAPVPVSQSNLRLVEECHRYKLRRKGSRLVRPNELRRRLISAVERIGDLPLKEADEFQLMDRLNLIESNARRFETTRALNELLLFSKRGFKLDNPPVPKPFEVAHVTLREFLEKIKNLIPDHQAVIGSLFACGCRWGELPVAKIDDKSVFITHQIRKEGVLGRTKNKKLNRRSPIIPPLKSFIMTYNAFPQEKKVKLRMNYKSVYRAFKRVFGIRIHDLRHSYAIELRTQGVEIALIAQYIGDTIKVCTDHYLNYAPNDAEIDRISKLWEK